MPPPDDDETRRGAAPDRPPLPKISASDAKAQGSKHDPAACATCLGFQPWTEKRRAEAAAYAIRRLVLAQPLEEVGL